MKKIAISLLALAAIAVSCKTAELEISPADSGITVTLTAEQPVSKTHLEKTENGWQPYWNEQDSIFVTRRDDLSKSYTMVNTSGAGVTASFSGKMEFSSGSGRHTIFAFAPKKAGRADGVFKFDMGPEQNIPALGSFDPLCDVLVSGAAAVDLEAGEIVATEKLSFTRMMSIVRLSVADGTTGSQLAGKKIKSAKLSTPGVTLSGRVRVNLVTTAFDSKPFESDRNYTYVTANYSGDDWTADGTSGVLLIVNPCTIAAGSTISLDVTFDDASTVSHSASVNKDINLADNTLPTFKFVLTDSDLAAGGEQGEKTIWDFSESAWQTAFQPLGSSGADIANINVTVNGLTYFASKGRYRNNCVQMTAAGSTSDQYLKFKAGKDGVLKVTASHTGDTPNEEQAKRSVIVNCGGSETAIVAGVSSKTPKECTFNVTAGDVYVYCGVGPLRIYKLEYTEGGSTAGGGEEPGGEEPAESAELDCPNPPTVGTVALDALTGYAAGVTGGEGATSANVLHFDNGKALQTWLLARTKSEKKGDHSPVVIWLSGTFGPEDGRDFSEAHPWFDVKDVSNLSFYGTDSFVMDRIGIFCVRASNIIIRNINFQQPKANNGADAVSMQECDGVWVDHCTFTSLNQTKDYEDGSTDITHGSKNVTVSWCRYVKTQKSCLVGHSNSQSGDVAITATFHHNWFEGSSSRHPRVRFGCVHVYNNLFDGNTTYGVGSAYGAKVLVEYNYFDAVQLPTDICTYPAKDGDVSNLQGSVAGYLYPTQNVYVNKPAKARDPYPLSNVKYLSYGGSTLDTPLTYADFKPAYSYTVTAAEDVPAVVKEGAGYGKLGWTAAPVAVNNGGVSEYNGTGDDPVNPDPENPEEQSGPHVYTLSVVNKTITQTKDGNAGASFFTSSESLADFSKDYKGAFTINDVTFNNGLKFDSKGSVSFTASDTYTSKVQFWFARRKTGDTGAKIQIIPGSGDAQVFDTPYDEAGTSGELTLTKGMTYTIKQKSNEQALILVVVSESE